MITKSYILDNQKKVVKAISKICDLIPCFIDAKDISPTRFEFIIKCRQEDISTVEKILAPLCKQRG